MGSLRVEDLKPGMRPAQDYRIGDQVVFPKGVPLTADQVAWLQDLIRKQEKAAAKSSGKLTDYRKNIVESEEFVQFEENYQASIDKTRVSFNQVLEADGEIDKEQVLEGVNECLEDCGGVFGSMIMMLQNLEGLDDSTYAHCVNVSLLSSMLGEKLNLKKEEIKILSLGGLLHDIGKLKMPEQIVQKPEYFHEKESAAIKKHPMEGYKLLSKKGLPEDVLMCVLQHHERCDGSGYPYGVKRAQINKYARIVAIADVFEALTSNRVYQEAMTPFEAMRILEEERYEKYEMEYLLTFLEYIAEVYVGMNVRLSNGKTGKIVMANRQALSRPLIQTKDGFIDLSKESKDLVIEEIL